LTTSETPSWRDQLNESDAAHATVKVAITVLFEVNFMRIPIA
jgi:hypothetical protein